MSLGSKIAIPQLRRDRGRTGLALAGTKGENYQWARAALVANKTRAMLQAGYFRNKEQPREAA
jgi:hypothetical protein